MAINQFKKRFLRANIRRETHLRRETKDAILWDILSDKQCRVKILGSNTMIVANYPENLENTPVWLKPGNSVKIMFTGGNRHSVEIVGMGQAIPTPTGGALLPTIAAGEDTVLVLEEDPNNPNPNPDIGSLMLYPFESEEMMAWISTGQYRISGVIYTMPVMTLSESNINTLGSGAVLENCAGAVSFSAAHASLYRIDIVVLGADGVFDVVEGTASATPDVPDTPTSHVLVGKVLIPPGAAYIRSDYLNRDFVAPAASQLAVSTADYDLAYGQNYTDITVTVLDQYGAAITGTSWGILAEIEAGGTGYLGTAGTATSLTSYTGSSANTVTIRYRRDAGLYPEEISPTIDFTLTQNPSVTGIQPIALRDESGNYMGDES